VRRRTAGRLLTGIALVLVLVVAAVVSGVLPVRVLRVESDSMSPTLDAGDLVLVARGPGDLRRGDVVVVRHPGTGEELVKRAVALGGDTVRLDDGVLVVDGSAVCEPAIDPDRIDGVFSGTTTVPDGAVFVLGDDRRDSIDSRDFGPVDLDDVLGHVLARAWPSPGPLPAGRC
jgi:signal peptidase I